MKRIAFALIYFFANYNAYAAPITNIVGNWHIDEGSGQKTLDSSGHAKHGQLGSTSGIDTNDPTWTIRRFDTAALHFDGNDFFRVPYTKILEPRRISVEAWVRNLGSPGDVRYIVSKSSLDCAFSAYALYTGNDGGLAFYISDGVGYLESKNIDQSIWDGNWHHVVGTYDQKSIRLYVDGIEVGGGTPANFPIAYSAFSQKDLHVGHYERGITCYPGVPDFADFHFIGDIDEVRIWNRALTAEEVAIRYKGD